MSYETYNESPLLLSGPDAALARNVLSNPAGFMDEFTEHANLMMKRPKQMFGYGAIQPTTYGQSAIPGTASGDWVDRFESYAAARARGDRDAAFAAISAEVKLDNTSGNVASVPLQFTPHEIGSLALGIQGVRKEEYKKLADAAGVAPSNEILGVTGKDFKAKIGQPISHLKAICSAPGAPLQIMDGRVPVTEAYLRNASSISASLNAETGATEFHIPLPAAVKIVGQSIAQKEAEAAFYAPVKELSIVPVSAPAVKVLEKHMKNVADSGNMTAIDAANIGEQMCNNECLDKCFIGKKEDIGSTIGDIMAKAYSLFPVSSQSPFTSKTEERLREVIGASQGAVMSKQPAGKTSSVSYEMYVGQNFLPQVGYHLESANKTVQSTKQRGVFEHEVAPHYGVHPENHAVISAKMSDGTVIDTMLVPVPGGVKIIGDHVHGGRKDGRHRRRRGQTSYAEDGNKNMYMGMLYN